MSLLLSTTFTVISLYYVVLIVSNSYIVATLLGLMWGVLIFFINRNLITPSYGKQNIVRLMFSIMIAFVLSITIAFPLQISMFGHTIKEEITQRKIQQNIEFRQELETDYNTRIEKQEMQLLKLQEIYMHEVLGERGSGKMGIGLRAKSLLEQIDLERQKIDAIHKQRSAALSETNIFIDTQPAFLEMLSAYNEIRNTDIRVNIIFMLTFFLFFLSETLPVTLILFTKKGLYEQLEEKITNMNYELGLEKIESQEYDKIYNKKKENSNQETGNNNFYDYCRNAIISVEHTIYQNDIKAKDLLRTGLLIIFIGMLAYIGYGLFLFIVYFETHKFETYHIFLFTSISILFFFIQFLGGWYLKEYRTTQNNSLHYTKLKEKYDGYILSDFLKQELTAKDTGLLVLINGLLNNREDIFEKIQDNKNENFAKEVFDSLNKLKDLIKQQA